MFLIHIEIPFFGVLYGCAPLTVHALLRAEASEGLAHALVRQGKDVLEALTAHCSEAGLFHLLCRQDNGIILPAARQGRFRSWRNSVGCVRSFDPPGHMTVGHFANPNAPVVRLWKR